MKCWVPPVTKFGYTFRGPLKFLALLAGLAFSQSGFGQGTQGEPIVNSGTSYGPSPIFVDASQFSGSDMCAKIQNARASSSCAASSNGCRIFAPFIGKQQCSVDPFSGWGSGGELDLRGTQNLDIRTSATWHIPNGVHLVGLGVSSPTSTGNGYVNTMLRANNTAIFNTTNGVFAIPSDPILNSSSPPAISVNMTTGTATVTVDNTMCDGAHPNNGQDVFIYGGPGIFAAYHGLALVITGQGAGGACVGGLATSFQVQVPTTTTNCTSGCGTVYEGTPLIQMADITLGAAQYRTQVEGLGVDCAFMAGCIPLVNTNAEEHSWFRNMNFYNTGGEYARISETPTAAKDSGGILIGSGAANSGPYLDWGGNLLGETCEITASSGCNLATGPGTGNAVYEGYDGTVTTSGVNVTYSAGSPFNTNWTGAINIKGTNYTISSVTGVHSLTLTASAGTNMTPVTYNLGTAFGTNPQNQNPLTCETLGLLVDGPPYSGVTTFPQNQIKKIVAFTLTFNDPANSGSPPATMSVGGNNICGAAYGTGTAPIGVLTYGDSVSVEDWHSEYIAAQVAIGGNVNLNAAFPGFQPGGSGTTPAITAGVKMSGLSGFGAGGATYQFDIGPNARDITLEEFSSFGTQTNLVLDNVTGNTCNNASDLAESHSSSDMVRHPRSYQAVLPFPRPWRQA